MPYEIERKFLPANSNWKKIAEPGLTIKQGYLNLEPSRTVRIRIIGNKGLLTIKGKTVNTTRQEFEYEIPLDDAVELLQLCEKPLLEKVRYLVHANGHTWEVDEFEGVNQGLIIAEIELEDENQNINIPDWIGEEVSDEPRYYNSNLVSHPFCEW